MKNIHLLPTDKYKSSRLLRNGKKLLLVDIPKNYTFFGSTVSVNIYITNDEEIKEGDWVLFMFDEVTEIVKVTTIVNNAFDSKEGFGYGLEYSKKIILTTDQELIKDGVQAIDDDFLEWFVKNPSCEKVDVWINKFYGNKKEMLFNVYGKYKIIIPKEESKQTVQEYEQQGLEKYSYESEPKQETIYEYTENYKPSFVDLTDILPKQETLEEVADRLYPYEVGYGVFDRNCEIDIERQRFIEGAKWQQEISYSEEDLKKAFQVGFNVGYNDETSPSYLTFEEWFEKFKKK